MEALKAFFSQGWVVALVGILAGLLIALYFYRASRIGPRPSYQLKALKLIAKDERALPEEVEILFKGMSVPRLTKTHVIFWNSGKAMLDGKQIVDADPLRLEFSKDAQVLRARIAKATRETNEFEVKINDKSPNEVICHFDYLDVGDGAVIELLHTDEERYPKIQGTMRGVPKGILNWGRIPPSRGRSYRRMRIPPLTVMMFFMIFMGLAIIVVGFLALHFTKPSASAEPSSVWVPVILGLVYISFPLFVLWITRRRFPKSLTIEDIEQ
jgi:hypothetical protein